MVCFTHNQSDGHMVVNVYGQKRGSQFYIISFSMFDTHPANYPVTCPFNPQPDKNMGNYDRDYGDLFDVHYTVHDRNDCLRSYSIHIHQTLKVTVDSI
jgi:hypothetical protein